MTAFTSECKIKPAFDLLFTMLGIKNTRSNPFSMVILKEKNTLEDLLTAPEQSRYAICQRIMSNHKIQRGAILNFLTQVQEELIL